MTMWLYIWTFVWFASLLIFSLLAVIVIIFGASDLVSLLKSLKARTTDAQPGEPPT